MWGAVVLVVLAGVPATLGFEYDELYSDVDADSNNDDSDLYGRYKDEPGSRPPGMTTEEPDLTETDLMTDLTALSRVRRYGDRDDAERRTLRATRVKDVKGAMKQIIYGETDLSTLPDNIFDSYTGVYDYVVKNELKPGSNFSDEEIKSWIQSEGVGRKPSSESDDEQSHTVQSWQPSDEENDVSAQHWHSVSQTKQTLIDHDTDEKLEHQNALQELKKKEQAEHWRPSDVVAHDYYYDPVDIPQGVIPLAKIPQPPAGRQGALTPERRTSTKRRPGDWLHGFGTTTTTPTTTQYNALKDFMTSTTTIPPGCTTPVKKGAIGGLSDEAYPERGGPYSEPERESEAPSGGAKGPDSGDAYDSDGPEEAVPDEETTTTSTTTSATTSTTESATKRESEAPSGGAKEPDSGDTNVDGSPPTSSTGVAGSPSTSPTGADGSPIVPTGADGSPIVPTGGNVTSVSVTKVTNKTTIAISTTTLTTTTRSTPSTSTIEPWIVNNVDINAIIGIIANLTYDYEWNLTKQFNESLIKHGVPTCPTPTTVTTTSTTPPQYDFANTSVVAKCFVCGLKNLEIPREAFCADAFAGDFLPLVPVDQRARGQIASFRKYCRFLDVHNYVENPSEPRSIYGRFTGGCGVRWTDLSGIYTQRTCRNRYKPLMGKHFASKRMAKLELALINVENGCIISPMASLLPLSRGISLYARFHACVCTGNWCNSAVTAHPWNVYITILWYIVINRI